MDISLALNNTTPSQPSQQWTCPNTSPFGIAEGGAYMGQIWFDNRYGASLRLEPTNWTGNLPRYEVGLIHGQPDDWKLLDTKILGADYPDDGVIRYATGEGLLDIFQKIRSL